MTPLAGPAGASRPSSPTARLARWGFTDSRAALRRVEDPALAGLVDLEADADGLLAALTATADPDLALRAVGMLSEAAERAGCQRGLREVLVTDGPERDRLVGVLGASLALGEYLARHPRAWERAAHARRPSVDELRDDLVSAVRDVFTAAAAGGDAPGRSPEAAGGGAPTAGAATEAAFDALRVEYRAHLVQVAALDVTSEDPAQTLPRTAAWLADLAGAALEAGLEIARLAHPDEAARARLAVIGMGKCGGRELNYVSDVDVVFVGEPAEGVAEDEGLAAATTLATTLMHACSAATGEGTLWPVDAALRPEGKSGPLVRTVASHVAYYRRWAKTWEFQALLKARPVAGDAELGRAYLDAVGPFVWEASTRDHFVEDVQAMRRRVEEHVPAAEAARQIKLGPGGLRDVEFTVQLLQLVHGRADDTLRSATTLDALEALAAGGYVAREDAAALDAAYRHLRTLEHRIQLYRLRRTHLMPTGEGDLRRLGRAVGHRTDPAAQVKAAWQERRREVRHLHERIFYRPLLAAVARLSTDEARLTPEAARARLSALGFRDPAGAMRHLEALTSGTTRTAAIQRQLLPVMLRWFADEADPDAGLLSFRRVSESLGSTHWYMKMLRDEGRAAERLAHVLARSRYAADLLIDAPETVRILAEQEGLVPRDRAALLRLMNATMRRKDDPDAAMTAARVIRRQELFRIALADLVGVADAATVQRALTDLNEAVLECALTAASDKVAAQRGGPLGVDLALIGMGRLGGRECGYASDADLVVVHRAHPGVDDAAAAEAAGAVVTTLAKLVSGPGPDPGLPVDLDLRPEGRSGPLSRTIEGYEAYYRRWALTWEAQALLRARAVAGDPGLGAEFEAVVAPIRWPEGGLDASQVREIRRLKARMESERLPRGADPKTHLKLGRGGLSDVEWTVQLIQMQHAHEEPRLRTTETLPALDVARSRGWIPEDDAVVLEQAWRVASAVRNAGTLWRLRRADSPPTAIRDAEGVQRILGRGPGEGALLLEGIRRAMRRARAATERVFYGRTGEEPSPTAPRRTGTVRPTRPTTTK